MYLQQSTNSSGKVYLSFVQGYRQNGKVKHKTIEKLGYLEDLEKKYDDAHISNKTTIPLIIVTRYWMQFHICTAGISPKNICQRQKSKIFYGIEKKRKFSNTSFQSKKLCKRQFIWSCRVLLSHLL